MVSTAFTNFECTSLPLSLCTWLQCWVLVSNMLWQSLANDVRLGEEVVDVLLEVISQGQDEQSQGAGSCKLEEVASVELGRVVSSLAMLLSRCLGTNYSQRDRRLLTLLEH